MLGIVRSRSAAIPIALVGLVFFVIGLSRHRNGASAAFMVIGLAFLVLGIRRMRRVAPDPAD